jgi:tetratricopeptide (TPR) repeat protein
VRDPDTYSHIRQAYETGSPALAALLAEQFLATDPDHPPVLLLLAQASTQLQRFDQARAAFDRLNELTGSMTAVLCRVRGDLEMEAGQFAPAEAWFRRAIDLAPTDASGYIRLGALFAVRGNLEAAAATHQLGTRCTEGPIDEACRGLGRYGEAKQSLDEAIRLTPDYPEARRARADVIQAAILLDEV